MSIELQKVRSLFEKRTRVTDVAFLIREIANRMNERLSVMKITPLRIMDAGCGHGDEVERSGCIFCDVVSWKGIPVSCG